MRRERSWWAMLGLVPALAISGAVMAQSTPPVPQPTPPPPALSGALDQPAPGAAAGAAAAAAGATQSAGQPIETVDELIARVRQRVEGIDNAAKERDQALKFLQDQIDAATGAISGGGEANEALRQKAATLSNQVDVLSEDRQKLTGAVDERSAALEQLQQQVASLTNLLGTSQTDKSTLTQQLASLRQDLEGAKGREQALTQQLQGLSKEGASRDEDLAKARQQVASLQQALESATAKATDAGKQSDAKLQSLLQQLAAAESGAAEAKKQAETRIASLQQQLTSAQSGVAETTKQADARIASLQQELATAQSGAADASKQAESRIEALQQDLGNAKSEAAASAGQITQLSRDVQLLRTQLETVSSALATTGDRAQKQNTVILDLTQRLNAALAAKIEELSTYRSDFFGRLRQALGDRPDFRVVGDRFVFQSEVLFDSGSAELDPEGQQKLHQLAQALKDVAATIPPDIPWILRVDGHTDIKPISNSSFRSNWELSTARAISVVEFLVRDGIPPERLVAAGFGEYQPLDPRNDEIAYRRNRRIEFKLTER